MLPLDLHVLSLASYQHAAPRLACVKPVASVHPEPGSNSSLYNISLPVNLHGFCLTSIEEHAPELLLFS